MTDVFLEEKVWENTAEYVRDIDLIAGMGEKNHFMFLWWVLVLSGLIFPS